MSAAWTVFVEFETNDGALDEFAAFMAEHARWTLANEPGCLRFELIRPIDDDGLPLANRLAVSELYRDREAYAEHRRSPRVPLLLEKLAALVRTRRRVLAEAVDLV